MRLDTNLEKIDPAGRPCRVTVRLKNGQSYTREAQHAKGGPEFPMTEAELEAKFFDCAKEVMPVDMAQQALDYVARLETLDNIRPLCERLSG
jgi:2-methylcitrate dehydratase PrpD